MVSFSWSTDIGSKIAYLSKLYARARDIFDPIGVETDILDWIIETNEGWEALRKVGEKYLTYTELESRRFKIVSANESGGPDQVIVDQDIPPKLPKHGIILPIHKHNGTGLVNVKLINDDLYVDERKIVLLPLVPKDYRDSTEKVIKDNNILAPVSASILDALLKFRYSLIPEHWSEKAKDEHGSEPYCPSILFSDTVYGEGNDQGIRGLSNGRGGGWQEVYLDYSLSWDHRRRIAVFEQSEKKTETE